MGSLRPDTTVRKPRRATKKPEATVTAARAPEIAPEIAEAVIGPRAFEIYTSGENTSNPDADWLQAEQELRATS